MEDRIEKLYETIKKFTLENQYPPTLKELIDITHIPKSTLREMMIVLEIEGYIECAYDNDNKRSPRAIKVKGLKVVVDEQEKQSIPQAK